MNSIGIVYEKIKNLEITLFFHPMQKCFWYVIFTGPIMIYDECAPHGPIILPQEEQIDQTRCLLYNALYFQTNILPVQGLNSAMNRFINFSDG